VIDGIEAITDEGTDEGTSVHETTTIDGELGIVTISLAGTVETSVAGTTTGLDQVVGTLTDGGSDTVDGTAETTEPITVVGTELGTHDDSMMTIEGDDGIVTIWVDGTVDTTEAGTITGDVQVLGTTEIGTVTVLTTIVTVTTSNDGTDDGTHDD